MITSDLILDRTGTRISRRVVDKGIRLSESVTPTLVSAITRNFEVVGDTGSYEVRVGGGIANCRCPGGTSGKLCAHQIAVWVYCQLTGDPVRMARIDGPEVRAVPDPDQIDIWEGLTI